MLKKQSKKILLLTIIVLVGVVFCLLNIECSQRNVYANPQSWEDYRASTLQLLDSSQPNSATNPYVISTAEELALISYNVSIGNAYNNTYFLQYNNIDLAGKNFVPIGINNKWFSGIYDGNGFVIDNLEIEQGFDASGLFGRVNTTANPADEAGTLRNIHITSGNIIAGTDTGSVVGYFVGKKIEHCLSGVTISSGEENALRVGGIIGRNLGRIENCYFYGEINLAEGQYIGGVVGNNGGSGFNPIIDCCFNIGKVQGWAFVGGIAGNNLGTINTVYNAGQIIAAEIAGGLVGSNDGQVIDGYNIGQLSFQTNFVGAVIGQNLASANTKSLYYNKDTSSSTLDIKAIGVIDRNISRALDDIDNDVQGLNYYQMLSRQIPFINESNWVYALNQQSYGRLPYPIGFNESVEDFAKLTLFGGNVSSSTWGDSLEDAYQITIPQQFNLIAISVEDGIDYKNKVFRLRNDINFINIEDYQPIGNSQTAFQGSFFGQTYIIKNLVLSSNNENIALFANTQNAIIENLTVDNFQINAEDKVAVISANDVGSQFKNIKITYTTVNGRNYTAGIIGYSSNSIIENCNISLSTIKGNNYVGSYGGYAEQVTVFECVSSAEITQSNNRVGGFFGYATGDIDTSYFVGSVQASGYVGGLVGEGSINITQSFVYTDLIVGFNYVGGLAGKCTDSIIHLAYARVDVQGNDYVGGLAGELADMTVSNAYYVGKLTFSSGGATIANIDSTVLQYVYYNSDLIESDNITHNGSALDTIQLTEGIAEMPSSARQGLFGYYPRITAFDLTAKVLESIRCNYFLNGDGSDQPYQISKRVHLLNMRNLIAYDYDNYKDKKYILTTDIYLIGDFEPIASQAQPFLGRLSGAYYGIYNLNINQPNEDYVGLFRYIGVDAYVEEVCIRSLVVGSGEIHSKIVGKNYVGAIAGYSEGYIWRCINDIDVEGNNYVGGLVGKGRDISRSFNTASVWGNDYVGGLAGYIQNSVQDSFNSGYIKADGNYSGGITAVNEGTIDSCFNSGDIESSIVNQQYMGNYKGGIVGQNIAGAIMRDSYNIGNIAGISENFIAGGIIADNLASNVMRVYYNQEINVGLNAIGQGNYGGENIQGLNTVQMVGSMAFEFMDFTPGKFISEEERGVDADFAPQLSFFAQKQQEAGKNVEIVDIFASYSKHSVMLRLFGRDVYNTLAWGSYENPYLISTFDHLDTLSVQVNAGHHFSNCYFVVTADIVALGVFNAIGFYDTQEPTNSKIFNGSFDGCGFVISQLNIGSVNSLESQGLFGYTGQGAVIKNVQIGADSFVQGKEKVGSIVGYSLGLVTRCHSSAIVTGDTSIGGIVGQLKDNQISHCVFDGDVTGSSNYWGGIVGRFENNASVDNCWHLILISKEYNRKENMESIIYNDKNGTVTINVDMQATNIDDFIYFELNPNEGFGFDVRNYSAILVEFNEGGIVGNRYYPRYNVNYRSVNTELFCRFTKVVTIASYDEERGLITGEGNYYEGQTVRVLVRPKLGYRLVLDRSKYAYTSDGESIDCTFTMLDTDWLFEAQFVDFGNEPGQIEKPGGGQTSFDSDVFVYDGLPKIYHIDIDIGGSSCETVYAFSDNNFEVQEAISANHYRLLIKLNQDGVIVGSKELFFTIAPKPLELDWGMLMSDEYACKQYDNQSIDIIDIPNELIIGIIANDSISLKGTRGYYDVEGHLDSNIGDNKEVRFFEFIVSGENDFNYSPPSDISGLVGSITKRDTWIEILPHHLSKKYDSEAPTIFAHGFVGDLREDGLNIKEFSFTIDDTVPNSWGVGVYKVGLTDNIDGNKDNYNIMFLDTYYYVIESRPIDSISFHIPFNLDYNGQDKALEISATFMLGTSLEYAHLIYYHQNQVVNQCIDAGNYIVQAVILDENFLLTNEQSTDFTIIKINQTTPLVIVDVGNITYATEQITLNASGGDGEGALVFEIVSGSATLVQDKLKINGTGVIKVRATKQASINYNKQTTDIVEFVVTKGVLVARIDDCTVQYGDNAIIEIYYEGMLRNENSKAEIKGLIEPTVYIEQRNLVVSEQGYKISLEDNGNADGYIIDVSQVNAKLFVTKKKIHIKANEITKIYGEEDLALTFSVLEENISGLVGSLKRVAGESVGRYLVEQHTLNNENNNNYDIVFIPNYLVIRPKELRVSVPVHTMVYGQNEPQPDFLINQEDLRFGDNFSVLSGVITRQTGDVVGQYQYAYSNVSAGINYIVRFTEVKYLDIIRANPDYVNYPRASNITYGESLAQSNITGLANVAGHFRWQDANLKPSVYNSNVTFYNALFVPDDTNNYNALTVQLQLTVEKRKARIAFIGNTNVVYDGSDKANLQVQAYNLLDGDEIHISIVYDADVLIDAGVYKATAIINDINYRIDGKDFVDIVIAKSTLDVYVKDATINQGESFVPEIEYSGFKGGDDQSCLIKHATVGALPKEFGKYDVKPQGAEAKNYIINYHSGKLIINRKKFEDTDLIIEGVMSPDIVITRQTINEKTENFALMKKYVDSILKANQYKSYTLNEFSNIIVSEKIEGMVTYRIKMAVPTDEPILVQHNDGSVEIVEDYQYSDGFVAFVSSNVLGVGTIRKQTWLESNMMYLIIAVSLVALLGVFFVVVIARKKIRKKRDNVRAKVFHS